MRPLGFQTHSHISREALPIVVLFALVILSSQVSAQDFGTLDRWRGSCAQSGGQAPGCSEDAAEARQERRARERRRQQREANALNDQGIAAYRSADYEQAVRLYSEALRLWPDEPQIAENLRDAQAALRQAQPVSTSSQAASVAANSLTSSRTSPPPSLGLMISTPSASGRSYRYTGNGLVGGTTWRVGFYAPEHFSEEQREQAMQRLRQQAELAGIPFNEVADFARYNFLIGVAASTSVWGDLSQRVIFDQLSRGQFTARPGGFMAQEGYNALTGRRFDELACHSNGSMICLAALMNEDIQARDVVLYGPQITPEALQLWNQLVIEGRVSSLRIFLNENDPVPSVSLLASLSTNFARGRSLMTDVSALSRAVQEYSPAAEVHSFSCGAGLTLDCHAMSSYTTSRGCLRASAAPAAVPGTRLSNGRSTTEPPSPFCPH